GGDRCPFLDRLAGTPEGRQGRERRWAMNSPPNDRKVSVPLGQVVITAKARDALHPEDVAIALKRHVSGDWGDLDEHDRQENELSLAQGFRLLSVYTDRSGTKFWI